MYELLNLIEDEAFVFTRDYRVLFLNNTLASRIPKADGRCFELLEKRDMPCDHPLWECPLPRIIREKRSFFITYPYTTSEDPYPKYIKVSIWPISDTEFLELRRDVSAERQLEKQIMIHHNHLDAISKISRAVSGLKDLRIILETALSTILDIFDGSIGGIMLLDEERSVLRYEVWKGFSLGIIEGREVRKGEGVSGRVAEEGSPILLGEVPESTTLCAEGIRSLISVPLKAKEKVVGVLNVMSTIPKRFTREDMYLLSSVGHQLGMAIEQARLYENLTNARERYRKLLQVALVIQEEERKRIARELHDETSQNLTALSLNLQAIKNMIEEEGLTSEVRELIKKSHAIAVSASVELTRIIRELRPTLLDTLGLFAAINHLVETNLKPKGIETEIRFEELRERLSSETELALFRITQEALSNIVRHSRAKKARIIFSSEDKEYKLVIEDDGMGFNVHEIKTIEEGGRGAGLFGMKERVRLVGGRCNIESSPGMGTRINVYVPRKKGTSDEEDKDTYS
ncbi:MAG: GAF domain-containing sensor histidine kinase [Desulfobacterota bacterium]|nr:GAF domain-containing sensor histidine kinase [Thermodesulfobacteriota bacterium]MDW8001493.1 GAF domain-containing sensor histidine kinase [Deltaproteobacteria bacterium]